MYKVWSEQVPKLEEFEVRSIEVEPEEEEEVPTKSQSEESFFDTYHEISWAASSNHQPWDWPHTGHPPGQEWRGIQRQILPQRVRQCHQCGGRRKKKRPVDWIHSYHLLHSLFPVFASWCLGHSHRYFYITLGSYCTLLVALVMVETKKKLTNKNLTEKKVTNEGKKNEREGMKTRNMESLVSFPLPSLPLSPSPLSLFSLALC